MGGGERGSRVTTVHSHHIQYLCVVVMVRFVDARNRCQVVFFIAELKSQIPTWITQVV